MKLLTYYPAPYGIYTRIVAKDFGTGLNPVITLYQDYENNNPAGGPYIRFQCHQEDQGEWDIAHILGVGDINNGGFLAISTNDGTQMRERIHIAANGSIGIACTDPRGTFDLRTSYATNNNNGEHVYLEAQGATLGASNRDGGNIYIRPGYGERYYGCVLFNSLEPNPTSIFEVGGVTAGENFHGRPIVLNSEDGGNLNGSSGTNGGDIILMPGTAQGSGTTGNIGIGTETPNSLLDVSSKTQATLFITGNDDDTGSDASYSGIAIYDGASNISANEKWFIGLNGSGGATQQDFLVFRSDHADDDIIITSDGLVGINPPDDPFNPGQPQPPSNCMLQINTHSYYNGIYVTGTGTGTSLLGINTTGKGVWGESTSDYGVYGLSTTSRGVYGSSVQSEGVYGVSVNSTGVSGISPSGIGVRGDSTSSSGVYGFSNQGVGTGGYSTNNYGVYARSDNNYGLYAWSLNNDAIYAVTNQPLTKFAGYFNGRIGTNLAHPGNSSKHLYDVAELIPCGPGVEYSDVVVINPHKYREVIKCTDQAQSAAGIISEFPQLCFGNRKQAREQEPEKNWQFLALAGQVPCKVDASYSEIKIGDLLMVSPTPGHAMKVKPIGELNGHPVYPQGSIVAKALEPLKQGKGKILVLVCLM